MIYTENYQLRKPVIGVDNADVNDLNYNSDRIDAIMHSSQISLADAYDINSTYNTGDVVMYEFLMYRCLEDNVTGVWNPEKWTRTTAGEGSGGGADLDIYGEASGTAEASFSDGAEASLVECEIGIVPTQDLHGYSKPWAGGAGKNKLPYFVDGTIVSTITVTVDSKGIITIQGTRTGGATIAEVTTLSIPAGTYIISDGTPANSHIQIYNATTNQLYWTSGTDTFEYNGTDTIQARIWINGNSVINDTLYPMLRRSTEPSGYEPYSNICPISGHTDVTVTVASTSGGSGDDTTVSLGRTVYGGTLDVTTGELTDGDGTPLLFNSANTNVWSGTATSAQGVTRFYTTPSYAGRELVMSDTYEISPNYATETDIITMSNDGRIIITPTFGQGKTLNEFKALLADNPFNVLMTLATPQTFNLTPAQVETLLGQNYVSHDGGGTISLVYIKKDSTIIPNPSDAEVPLTGLEISGKDFVITDARIPAPPTTNGAYVLTVTVSGGTPTYSWENA